MYNSSFSSNLCYIHQHPTFWRLLWQEIQGRGETHLKNKLYVAMYKIKQEHKALNRHCGGIIISQVRFHSNFVVTFCLDYLLSGSSFYYYICNKMGKKKRVRRTRNICSHILSAKCCVFFGQTVSLCSYVVVFYQEAIRYCVVVRHLQPACLLG